MVLSKCQAVCKIKSTDYNFKNYIDCSNVEEGSAKLLFFKNSLFFQFLLRYIIYFLFKFEKLNVKKLISDNNYLMKVTKINLKLFQN